MYSRSALASLAVFPAQGIGWPPLGNGPASVESVRLDPELTQALDERAAHDGETTSAVIRDALRTHLQTG